MIAQKHRPLAIVRNRRRLLDDIDNWKPVLHLQRHEHARHQREMKTHVRFIALAKVRGCILRPLIRFSKQHPVWKFCVDVRA